MAKRERIWTGERFYLDAVEVPRKSGGIKKKDMLGHPGAVALVPVLDDGRFVLIENHRFAVEKTIWEIPAGTLEPGEAPIACAARELIEETGYEATKLEPLAEFYTAPGFCNERMHVFLATGLRHVGQKLEETEQITVHLVEAERVREMLRDGVIEDSKTMAALYKYLALS